MKIYRFKDGEFTFWKARIEGKPDQVFRAEKSQPAVHAAIELGIPAGFRIFPATDKEIQTWIKENSAYRYMKRGIRSDILRIEVYFDTLNHKASVETVFRAKAGVRSVSTPIDFFRVQTVLESLKAKGYDKPLVKYASTYYGITLSYEIRSLHAK